MRRIAHRLALAGALGLAALMPFASGTDPAAAAAPCESGSTAYPKPTFDSLPSIFVTGREATVSVTYSIDYHVRSTTVTASAGGTPVATSPGVHTNGFVVTAPAGVTSLDLTATYLYEDVLYHQKPSCESSTTVTVPVTSGAPVAAPQVVRRRIVSLDNANASVDDALSPTVGVRLRPASDCSTTQALSPVAFRVRLRGTPRWTSVVATDVCAGWQAKAAAGKQVVLGLTDDPNTAYFVPRTGRKNSTKRFQYEVRAMTSTGQLGRAIRRGGIVVRTRFEPAQRVYAVVGGHSNDEYWNDCVANGKDVWMDHGNAYCMSTSWVTRKVALTKR